MHCSIICAILIQIARRLLGKLLIDLRNTREEAISVAELKSNQDNDSSLYAVHFYLFMLYILLYSNIVYSLPGMQM
jgi:hypothetical protein